ncbi:MAG TPA: chemotaxis protein CheX [Syntrophomonadaceae bacterium]|nr:chemotaxis protein CheX [Syntrophomonadaceae bacterium]
MDIKYINGFINGLLNVCGTLGLSDMKRTGLAKREHLEIDKEVNIVQGMVGSLNGNVVLSMEDQTARNIASLMMGGMEVATLDMIPKSALCELANMISGNSVAALGAQTEPVEMSPPTLVNGKRIVALVSLVETLEIQFSGATGTLSLSIALEG